MKIVHEVQIDTRWPWWKRQRQSLLKVTGFFVRAFVISGLLIALGVVYYHKTGSDFILAIGCAFALVYGSLWLKRWRTVRATNRAAANRLGPILTQFVAFTDAGVTVGARQCSETFIYWDLCRVVWKRDFVEVYVTAGVIPLSLKSLDPQHVQQIRYWSTRHQTKDDLCPHCKYDLKASPGPACPECGKPIRVVELAEACE